MDDDFRAARGIAVGTAMSAVLWALLLILI